MPVNEPWRPKEALPLDVPRLGGELLSWLELPSGACATVQGRLGKAVLAARYESGINSTTKAQALQINLVSILTLSDAVR